MDKAFSTIQQANGRVPLEVKASIRGMNPPVVGFGGVGSLKNEKLFSDNPHSNKRMEIEHKAASVMLMKSK